MPSILTTQPAGAGAGSSVMKKKEVTFEVAKRQLGTLKNELDETKHDFEESSKVFVAGNKSHCHHGHPSHLAWAGLSHRPLAEYVHDHIATILGMDIRLILGSYSSSSGRGDGV